MAAFTLAALNSEIINDPAAIGYATPRQAGDDVGVANLINAVQGTITVFRNNVGPTEVLGNTTVSGYSALTAAQQGYYNDIVGLPFIDATNATLRTNLATMFPAGSPTRTALLAVAQRNGSRAEQLWGTGFVVTPLMVAQALGRT